MPREPGVETMTTTKCPKCQRDIPANALICEFCGHALRRDPSETIISLPSREARNAVLSGWGTTQFTEKTQVVLHFKDGGEPIIVQPTTAMIMGRVDRNSGEAPDIDLTAHGGIEKGVSRQHAVLRRDEEEGALVIVDLGSTNGTFINEEQLTPSVPYTLHDGDTVRVGQLVMHLYFRQPRS